MIVVIQCGAGKVPAAGSLQTVDGRKISFVADPKLAPRASDVVYARPDDPSDQGGS